MRPWPHLNDLALHYWPQESLCQPILCKLRGELFNGDAFGLCDPLELAVLCFS